MNRLLILILTVTVVSSVFSQTGPGGVEQTNGSSNLGWWLKADEGVYEDAGSDAAETGDGVYQWNDASGNAIHIQQTSSSSRPEYVTGAINGLPVIRFNASNSEFLGGVSADLFQNNYSLFIVGYTSGNTETLLAVTFSVDHGILIDGNASNQLRFLHRNPTGATGGNNIDAGSSRSTSSVQILSFSRGTPSGGTQQFWINGTDNQSTTGSQANFTSTGTIAIGRLGASYSSRYMDGDMAEVIIMTKEVNEAERIIIENYLASKYGISLGANDIYDEDESGAGSFDYEVAGIGRVDASNIHDDAQGVGMLRISNPLDLGDNEFLMWGHNNGAREASEVSDVPSGVEARLARVWRASEVNSSASAVDVGAIDISFDLNGLGPVTDSDLRLIVDTDNDGVFSDETAISGASDQGGDVYQFAGVTAISDNLRFTLGTIDVSQTPLPIELNSFTASVVENRYIQLRWETSSEINNDFFTVERSIDGDDWISTEVIKGAGNSSSLLSYSSVDFEPFTGTSYYRLKQTDFDGNSSYSQIVSVHFDKLKGSEIEIFPNPTKELLTLTGSSEELEKIQIFNLLGQEVTAEITFTERSKQRVVIDLSKLLKGTYLLKTRNFSRKIYKQ